jgi:hypothetical protein
VNALADPIDGRLLARRPGDVIAFILTAAITDEPFGDVSLVRLDRHAPRGDLRSAWPAGSRPNDQSREAALWVAELSL